MANRNLTELKGLPFVLTGTFFDVEELDKSCGSVKARGIACAPKLAVIGGDIIPTLIFITYLTQHYYILHVL